MAASDAYLQLHIEPQHPIVLNDLTAALGSLARQYQDFALERDFAKRVADAKLLVASAQPGSIDISLVPELAALIAQAEVIEKFAGHIKWLLDLFQGPGAGTADVSIKDCDDAINIVKPIAEEGGEQTFNVINGEVTVNVLTVDANDARKIVEGAAQRKAVLQFPEAERRQRVSMIWTRLDREKAKTEGRSSPDKALIEEIDPKPRPVFFTDEMSYLKEEMVQDEENPMQKVYFVDVEVSRVEGKPTAYRVVGYHGKDDLGDDTPPTSLPPPQPQ